jgi:hypothetical protein
MTQIKKYGTTDEETNMDDQIRAREIVQEIMRFGVSQQQLEQIVYLLALELENRELMNKIGECFMQEPIPNSPKIIL